MTLTPPAPPLVTWQDADGLPQQAPWRSLAGHPPPARLVLVDDRLSADAAWRLVQQGTGLLWQGDYQNARHLLQALARRLDAPSPMPSQGRPRPVRSARSAGGASQGAAWAVSPAVAMSAVPAGAAAAQPAPAADAASLPAPSDLSAVFHAQRQAQARRARLLGLLLLPFDADHGLPLRRAPDVRAAALAAHGPVDAPYVASLRELLGLIGAWQWREKGVPVPALAASIHPHHGVFAPVRGEYVDLVAKARLPAAAKPAGVFDIGTGTGVLAAVLARRKLRVTATDVSPAALACAADNLARLGLADRVTLQQADMFPRGKAGIVVCNPPWLPAQPGSLLDAAIFDPDSRMLRAYLAGLARHLAPQGRGLADPVRPGRAAGPAQPRAADGLGGRRRSAGAGPHRHPAGASQGR